MTLHSFSSLIRHSSLTLTNRILERRQNVGACILRWDLLCLNYWHVSWIWHPVSVTSKCNNVISTFTITFTFSVFVTSKFSIHRNSLAIYSVHDQMCLADICPNLSAFRLTRLAASPGNILNVGSLSVSQVSIHTSPQNLSRFSLGLAASIYDILQPLSVSQLHSV